MDHKTEIVANNENSNCPQVKVVTIEGNTHLFDIVEGLNFIGRVSASGSQMAQIAIKTKDNKISRKHCCLKYSVKDGERSLTLFDANSSNGTFLKGFHHKPISEYDVLFVKHNDVITIGETKVYISVPLGLELKDATIQKNILQKSKTVIWNSKR